MITKSKCPQGRGIYQDGTSPMQRWHVISSVEVGNGSGQLKMDRGLSHISQKEVSFGIIRGIIVQRRMEAIAVIKHLEIINGSPSGLFPGEGSRKDQVYS